MTQQNYSNIENGTTEITADRLTRLSAFYNVSIDCILGLTNKKEVNK